MCMGCTVICMDSKWMLVVYNDAMIMREDYSAEAFMCVNLLVNKKVHDVMYICNIYQYYWGRVRKVMHTYVWSMSWNIVVNAMDSSSSY